MGGFACWALELPTKGGVGRSWCSGSFLFLLSGSPGAHSPEAAFSAREPEHLCFAELRSFLSALRQKKRRSGPSAQRSGLRGHSECHFTTNHGVQAVLLGVRKKQAWPDAAL